MPTYSDWWSWNMGVMLEELLHILPDDKLGIPFMQQALLTLLISAL